MDALKSFEFERHPECLRLTLGASLNAFHWEDIERSAAEILAELEKARSSAVIVDLTLLDYLGSAQLTLLVRIWKAVKGRDGRMIVEVKAPVVREVLKTAGLLNVWEFADSRTAAFEMLGLAVDGRRAISPVVPAVGLAALAGAIAGVCLPFWRADALDVRILLTVQLACSAVALGTGLWTAIWGSGMRRGLGVSLVVASALVAVAGVFHSSPRMAASRRLSAVERPAKGVRFEKRPGNPVENP